MKIKIVFGALFFASSLVGYTATPNEFPGAFIKQAQTGVDAVIEGIKDFDALSGIMVPIGAMNNSASLNTVQNNLAELERMTMSEGSNAHIDAIRLAGLYKLSVPLILKMNDCILEMLSQVENILSFWKDSQEYRIQFFLHRKSPKVIIHNLQRIQDELCTLFGSLVQHVNKAPFGKDKELQYAWLNKLYAFLNNQEASAKAVMTQPVFESVAAMLARSISFVLAFNSQMEKRLYEYGKPSWIRRNLGAAIAGTALVGTGGPWIVKNKNEIKQKATDAYTSVSGVVENQRDLVREAFFEQGKGLADIADRRRKIGNGYRDFLYGLLLEYSSDEQDRKNAIFHAIQRKDSTSTLNSASELSALERKYEEVYGGKRVPQPKLCVAQLSSTDYDFLTSEQIEAAALGTDQDFLLEQVIPLLTKTLQEEGGDAREALAALEPVASQIGLDLEPVLNALRPIGDAPTIAGGIWTALFRKNGKDAADDSAEASSAATEKSATPERIDYKTVIPKLTEEVAPLVHTGLAAMPQAFLLAINSAKLSAERMNWQWKWVKAIGLAGIASIPVYGIYKLFASLYKKCKKNNNFEDLFDTLRELKKLLLVNGEKQQSEMDPCDVGLMYYLIHRLECVHVPAKYSATFLNDVRLLQSPGLSAKQKYKIVKDVLQGGYPFLRPVGATTK